MCETPYWSKGDYPNPVHSMWAQLSKKELTAKASTPAAYSPSVAVVTGLTDLRLEGNRKRQYYRN